MYRDRFVEIAICHQVKQRTKGFVLHDVETRFCRCEARFHVTAAGNGEPLPAVKNFAAFIFQSLDRMLNKIDSALIDERSHYGFAIKRISDWQTLVSGEEFIADFRRD